MTDKIPKKVIAAVIATGLLSFCGVIIETSMNVTFPTLMKEFSISTSTVQWMTSSYLLVVAIIVPTSAVLKKSFKTKTLFTAANLFFMAGVLIDAFAPSFPLLLLGRAIQGIGTGIALPLMFNIILEQVPKSRLGLMMGVGNLITGIAPAIGPTFGGIIATRLSWRWVFYLILPLLVISLLLGRWGILQKAPVQKESLDLLSMLFIAATFTGMVTGFANLSSGNFFSLSVGGAFLLGLIGMVGLIWRSLTYAHPVLKLSLLGNHAFAGHVLGFFLTQIMSLGFAFLLPNYVQLVNGDSSMTAGLLVLPAGFAGAIFAPLGGRILDRFGARRPILFGMSLCLFSLLVFSLISRNMANWQLAIVYIFYMAGMGICMGNVMTSGLRTLPSKDASQGNAILNTLQQFAGAMGTSIAAMIVSASQMGTKNAARTALGTQHAFFVLTALCLITWLSYWRYVRD
jgi:DHA2 family lincomycin resistance protein-like MFS transporter